MDMNTRLSRSAGAKVRKTPTQNTRDKAIALLLKEEKKSDKRQVVADAFAAKLCAQYARNDAEFAESIRTMTNRLMLHSSRRILKSDMNALEAVVKRTSLERQRSRVSTLPTNSKVSANETSDSDERHVSKGMSKSSVSSLKGQDEWVLLNALTLVEYEKEKEKDKARTVEKKKIQRAWLDAQKAEKEAAIQRAKEEGQLDLERQQQSLAEWREQEKRKRQEQIAQVHRVRQERDEQLRQQQERHQHQLEMQRLNDAAEVERVKKELRRREEEMLKKKEAERERTKKLQSLNASIQVAKDRQRQQEQETDVELMRAYAEKLDKEERERAEAMELRLKRLSEIEHSIASSIHAKQVEKDRVDERRAEEYQRQKNLREVEEEERKAAKRKQEELEYKKFLSLQKAQKQEREHQEIVEDLDYAQLVVSDSKAAAEEQKMKLERRRKHNVKFQEQLLRQIDEQKKDQPLSTLQLPRTLMNSREKQLNAKLLEKLDEPEITAKVLEKLTPVKDTGEGIKTAFY